VTSFRNGRNPWLACLLLALVTLVLYWPVRHFDFVQYDDNNYVFDNPTVCGGLSWGGLVWSFVDAHASNWHPLTWLSHMLDCQLFGLNPGAAHLVNVLLHCANAVLLLLLLRSMTGAFWRSALVAALFAWHPLRVESVAWISERKDVLSGFFFMLTLWTYVLYAQRQGRTRIATAVPTEGSTGAASGSGFYALSLIFFTLGLLSKPMLVTVPFVLLLLDIWPLDRFRPLNRADTAGSPGALILGIPRRRLIEKIPFGFLAAILAVITLWAQRYGNAVVPLESFGVGARIENALVDYGSYLEKFFWPRNLTCLYLRPTRVPGSSLAVAVMVLAAISALAIVQRRRRPYFLLGWLWFLGMLIPVCGLIQVGLQSIADRYTYLPSIGLALVLVWGGGDLAAGLHSERARRIAAGGVAVLLLSICAILTRHQLGYWKDTRTLMEHALQIDPNNYVAHDDLGVYYSKLGRTQEALFHYRRARELDPALKPPAPAPPGPSAPQ
jgi:protein O-mannosyl-transferase